MQNDLGWGAIGAVIGVFLTGLFGWLTQRSKGETDQGVAVLAEWGKLNDALKARIEAVEKECAEMRREHAAEVDDMHRRHRAEVDEMRRQHRAEMRAMRELNEGLQRMIAQNSQSTAYLIGDSPVTKGNGDD